MAVKVKPGRPAKGTRVIFADYADGIEIKTDDEDPQFNSALARGLAVLRAFEADRTMLGNHELAEATALPKSTVSRLTHTLAQLGYLRYLPNYGKYVLAPGIVGLAYPYLARQVAPTIARPLMAEFAKRSKTNVGFGVHDGLSVYYLEYAMGEIDPNRRQRAGFRVPLVRTSIGRACIAGMTPEDREDIFIRGRAYYKNEWPALKAALDDAVAQVAARGFCIACDSFQTGVSAVALPFSYGDQRSITALNSQGRVSTQTNETLMKNGRRLLDLARELRTTLERSPNILALGR